MSGLARDGVTKRLRQRCFSRADVTGKDEERRAVLKEPMIFVFLR